MDQARLMQTPSQTVGPYFAYGLTPEQYFYNFKSIYKANLVEPEEDNAITITGQVLDGEGQPINDALVEIWQNDGQHALLGRCGTGTDKRNRFKFTTIKPVPTDGNGPFITVILFMRGQLIHSYTRIYFEDETTYNDKDKTLSIIQIERRHTLIAKKIGNSAYHFDIHMQGENETVFFAL